MPPKYPSVSLRLREFLNQCGFGDARFATNERAAAAALGGGTEPFLDPQDIVHALAVPRNVYPDTGGRSELSPFSDPQDTVSLSLATLISGHIL